MSSVHTLSREYPQLEQIAPTPKSINPTLLATSVCVLSALAFLSQIGLAVAQNMQNPLYFVPCSKTSLKYGAAVSYVNVLNNGVMVPIKNNTQAIVKHMYNAVKDLAKPEEINCMYVEKIIAAGGNWSALTPHSLSGGEGLAPQHVLGFMLFTVLALLA